jgi:hypothetical protein
MMIEITTLMQIFFTHPSNTVDSRKLKKRDTQTIKSAYGTGIMASVIGMMTMKSTLLIRFQITFGKKHR